MSRLMWHYRFAGTGPLIGETVKQAVHHVIEDEIEPGDREVVEAIIGRAEPFTDAASVSQQELDAIERVMTSACSYMYENNYADESDFPEDAQAARCLGRTGHAAWSTIEFPSAANVHRAALMPGTRIRHAGQQYTEAYRDGTAVITKVLKRYPQDGSYEYEVRKDDGTITSWNHVREVGGS